MWSRYLSRISMKSCWYIDASVRSFFRCTRSSTISGGLMNQGGNTKYEGVSKMSENSMLEADKNYLMRRPKVWMKASLQNIWNLNKMINHAMSGSKPTLHISEQFVRFKIPDKSTVDHLFHGFTDATCQGNRTIISRIHGIQQLV